ncbi:ATP-binding cassette sub-family G member 4 [Neocloeon triangulifer]|uniref:ATP-binding cassette sub-family G member 4 n=1 Tax=Neocloeon triangulifer TaxID=2078957 RepID=UPI00286F1CEA|nr:ATP-binding cassette sub-family G member 4 [Neocloeon triangulifer]
MSVSILNNNLRFEEGVKVEMAPILASAGAAAMIQPAANSSQTKMANLPQRPPVELAFSELTYRVSEGRSKGRKTILKSVSGLIRPRELTAIMGPSGAGKSSLLNILTGYKTTGMSGSITVNGAERNLSHFRKQSCYIMQDNQLHANLTVQEAMRLAASLKLSKDYRDKPGIIRDILETLSLLEHEHTMTSNLSGGQKKRLSIALELINNPPVMFFDEPTSGLDSSSCYQCIKLLKDLSRGGRTIVCTIHQPSARLFEMFDQLYTLAEGQCIYQGNTSQLVPWLSSRGLECPSYHNPASYIIEVSCGEYGENNVSALVAAIGNGKHDIREGKPWPEVKDNNQVVAMKNGDKNFAKTTTNYVSKDSNLTANLQVVVQREENGGLTVTSSLLEPSVDTKNVGKRYETSEWHQFWIILQRAFLFSRRDWTLMYLRLFAHILVGFLIGALYYDIGNEGSKVLSNLGFLFFNMLFLMYTSMTVTILSFPLEMPVLLKENFNRWYSLRSYYLAITISDIPFQAIFCVLYVSIVYYCTSQPYEWFRFGMFLAACLMISFVAQSIGLVVGAAMNVQNGVFLAPVMSVPFLLFSGFFVSFDAIPIYLRWITYLSYIRYGFEGTALATYAFGREKLKCSQMHCHFKKPETTLEELDMVDADYRLDIIALVVIFVILRVAAFLFLRWKLKSNR